MNNKVINDRVVEQTDKTSAKTVRRADMMFLVALDYMRYGLVYQNPNIRYFWSKTIIRQTRNTLGKLIGENSG